MKHTFYILTFLFLYMDTPVEAQNNARDRIIKAGTVIHLISEQFSFTEGPAADKAGNVFFSDQPDNSIWKYDVAGKLSLFLKPAGRSNGMCMSNDGHLLSCADEKNEIWSLDDSGKSSLILKEDPASPLNGPNDLWQDKKNGIYFTDPYYHRDYWPAGRKQMRKEYVYYLAPGATVPVIVADDLVKPNGIAGSADGHYLYVADIGADLTYRYTITAEGLLTGKQVWLKQGSDGMTLDAAGNFYLTGKGVSIYNPEGVLITVIAIPRDWTSNVCFGGPDHTTLFITASAAVYSLQMLVKGVSGE